MSCPISGWAISWIDKPLPLQTTRVTGSSRRARRKRDGLSEWQTGQTSYSTEAPIDANSFVTATYWHQLMHGIMVGKAWAVIANPHSAFRRRGHPMKNVRSEPKIRYSMFRLARWLSRFAADTSRTIAGSDHYEWHTVIHVAHRYPWQILPPSWHAFDCLNSIVVGRTTQHASYQHTIASEPDARSRPKGF